MENEEFDPNQIVDDCVQGVDCWMCERDIPHKHAPYRTPLERADDLALARGTK